MKETEECDPQIRKRKQNWQQKLRFRGINNRPRLQSSYYVFKELKETLLIEVKENMMTVTQEVEKNQ